MYRLAENLLILIDVCVGSLTFLMSMKDNPLIFRLKSLHSFWDFRFFFFLFHFAHNISMQLLSCLVNI